MDDRISHSDFIYTFLHATLRDRQDIVQFSMSHSQFSNSKSLTDRISTLETKVKLTLNYSIVRRTLSVMVIHVRGLWAENMTGVILYEGLPTTKVKLRLYCGSRYVDKRKTQAISSCPHPTFNEHFSIQVSEFEISEAVLEVSIKEMRIKQLIYSTVIPLKNIKNEGQQLQWFNLKSITRAEQ